MRHCKQNLQKSRQQVRQQSKGGRILERGEEGTNLPPTHQRNQVNAPILYYQKARDRGDRGPKKTAVRTLLARSLRAPDDRSRPLRSVCIENLYDTGGEAGA